MFGLIGPGAFKTMDPVDEFLTVACVCDLRIKDSLRKIPSLKKKIVTSQFRGGEGINVLGKNINTQKKC